MPIPSLPEQPGRTPVPVREARDAAFVQWLADTRYSKLVGLEVLDLAALAFAAGWDATLGVERKKLDTGSLFPTMGLDHDV